MTLKKLEQAREWKVMDPAAKKWIVDNWSEEFRRQQSAGRDPVQWLPRWLQELIKDGRLPKDASAWARVTIQKRLIEDLTR